MRIYKKNIPYYILSTLLLAATIVLYVSDKESDYISVCSSIMSILFIIKFRTCIPLFVLFAFLGSYSFTAAESFLLDIMVSPYRDCQEPQLINHVLLNNITFIFFLGNAVSAGLKDYKVDFTHYVRKSHYLFWFLVIIGILMIQFGIQGTNILVSGGYGAGGTVAKSSLHEYYILVFFMTLLVRPPTPLTGLVLFCLYLVYCAKTFLFGGRVEVLEITLLYFYYYKALPLKTKPWKVYIFALIASYLQDVTGAIRSNPIKFLEGDYATVINPFRTSEPKKVIVSNQGDVIQASARIMALVRDGYIGTKESLASFFGTVFGGFLPSSVMPKYVNLSAYRPDVYLAGGGGLIGTYFYVWLGYAGPAIAGLFIAFFITKLYRSQNLYSKIYGLAILCTFPRWYAYGPIFLFKFCVFTALVYFILKLIFRNFLTSASPGNFIPLKA